VQLQNWQEDKQHPGESLGDDQLVDFNFSPLIELIIFTAGGRPVLLGPGVGRIAVPSGGPQPVVNGVEDTLSQLDNRTGSVSGSSEAGDTQVLPM
jgi:hypothetical protein